MSDSQGSDDRAPRPGAGDAARTQPIPRISREKRPRTVADALREARSAPAESDSSGPQRRPGPARPARGSGRGDAVTKPESSTSASATSRPKKQAATPAPSRSGATNDDTSGAKTSGPTPNDATKAAAAAPAADEIKKSSGSSNRSSTPRTSSNRSASARESTPTAADYARTTGTAADTTSVMPAVKDEPRRSTPAAEAAAPAPSGRQAKLRLTFIEPWSVTRLAFVVSVALMIVAVVAVTIFWVVLEITGIWGSLNDTVLNVLSDSEGSFDLTDYLGLGRLVGLTLVLSAVNVVLMTAVATIAAHLYNLAAQLLGGIEVTFTDD